MKLLRLLVLPAGAVLLVAVAATGGALATDEQAPAAPFGSHVSLCAQSGGIGGDHNPSHHRGSSAHDVDDMHC